MGACVIHADVFAANTAAGFALAFVFQVYVAGRYFRHIAENVGLG